MKINFPELNNINQNRNYICNALEINTSIKNWIKCKNKHEIQISYFQFWGTPI